MSSWLLRARFSRSTLLAPEELKKRLAAATADWSGDWRGRSVPQAPWAGDSFVASPGMSRLGFSVRIVVSGKVRANGCGSQLDVVVRPGGHQIVLLAIPAVWMGADGLLHGELVPWFVAAVLLGIIEYALLLMTLWTKQEDVAHVLEDACGDSGRGRSPPR